MRLVRRFRIPALFCALAVLVCAQVSRPYARMGICDDGPYILMAQHLAATGQIAYTGWAAPLLGWQLYLGAAFIKLFGYSFTTVRMSTLLVAAILAFVLQRTLVRARVTERNATIGTLALVLSPLFLMLSVTYMTDIQGLFAIVVCLYGCLRALQASTSRAAINWLCFAVAANAIFGTARQIAWLGVLVMAPSTLWLLRGSRRVLFAGAAANVAGALFILGCMQWLKHQPYVIPEHLLVKPFPLVHALGELLHTFLDIPFTLLPLMALFLPEIRKSRPLVIAILLASLAGYIFLAIQPDHFHHLFLLEPTQGGQGAWVGVHGIVEVLTLKGEPPIFLGQRTQVLLTIVSLGGMLCLIASLLRSRRRPAIAQLFPADAQTSAAISWKQLGVLLLPFTLAYILLLMPSAASYFLFDRYLLPLLVIVLLCVVRYYQERVQSELPLASLLLIATMSIYGVAVTHNQFALNRARVALAAELRAAGIPETSVDSGWDYNIGVELHYADHINQPRIEIPAHAYVPIPPLPAGTCNMAWNDQTPHIHPRYGISFDPNACYGPAPFSPVHYSRWLASSPGTLYVINYIKAPKL